MRLRRRGLGLPRWTERRSSLSGVTGAGTQNDGFGCVFGMQWCEMSEASLPPPFHSLSELELGSSIGLPARVSRCHGIVHRPEQRTNLVLNL